VAGFLRSSDSLREGLAIMDAAAKSPPAPVLRRAITLGPLLFCGLSVIVGAGIYVAIGSVLSRAGDAAPVSFLLAGLTAGLTGMCYAELASRFPEAAGAAAYVKHGFNSQRLAQVIGAAVALAVAIAAASIARGAVQYLSVLVGFRPGVLTSILVILFSLVAMLGVRQGVGLAAAMGAVEIAGILLATIAGFLTAPDFQFREIFPASIADWRGVAAGAFIAFFAFIGFETLANMAEEVKDPRRNVPRGILGALAVSTLLYVIVTSAVVMAGSSSENALIGLFEGRGATVFATIGAIAISNGVLAEIMMLARLFYGMAKNGQLPTALATVHHRTQTPILATALAGALVLATSLLLPFEHLLVLANVLTLGVFLTVDLALWRVKLRTKSENAGFVVPGWVPPLAAAAALGLMLAEFVQ
jgi:basic amino acid/polyamine antiporter, APA family